MILNGQMISRFFSLPDISLFTQYKSDGRSVIYKILTPRPSASVVVPAVSQSVTRRQNNVEGFQQNFPSVI
jgi:hypothetical protein